MFQSTSRGFSVDAADEHPSLLRMRAWPPRNSGVCITERRGGTHLQTGAGSRYWRFFSY